MTLWERIKNGMEEGFDAAIAAMHNLTEKAEENIEMTRLRRERTRYETQLTRLLAELGNTVYERVSKERNNDLAEQLGVTEKIKAIAEKDAYVIEIDKKLAK